jgi:hypothetical protein
MKKKPSLSQGSMIKKANSPKSICDLRMRTEPRQNIFNEKVTPPQVSTVDHVFRQMAAMAVNLKKGTINHSTGNLLRPDVIKRRGLGDLAKRNPSQFMLPVRQDLLWDVSKIKNLGSYKMGRTKGGPKSKKEKSVMSGEKAGRGNLNPELEIRNYRGQKKAMRN